MGKKGGDDGGAAQARADEAARQAKIRAGTTSINTIFDGGKTATGAVPFDVNMDRSKTYYNKDGSVFDWGGVPGQALKTAIGTSGGLGGSGGQVETSPTGPAISGGLPTELYTSYGDTPGQFGDDFYKKLGDNYTNYAQPQLDRQFGDAQKQLTYSLARGGNLDSSTRGFQEGQLKTLYDTNTRAVKDTALNNTNDARNNVESARADLIRTLNTSGDAEGATSSALARANSLSQPQGYSPLGQMFSTFTAGLGTQAALEKANYYSGGAVAPRYNTGLFGNSGAVKVS